MLPHTDSAPMTRSEPIRCLLLHDHVLLRQGLRRLFEDEPDIDVVGEAAHVGECLHKVDELQPDVLVADARAFDLPSHDVELCIAERSHATKVVFLTTQEHPDARFEGLYAATRDCAVRHTSAEELVNIIRQACGRTNYRDSTRRDLRCSVVQISQKNILTAREREVLKLLAEGRTVRAAATVLGISVKTVDAHKFNLMRKLGVHNKAELVMCAIQNHVVKVPVNF